MSEAPEQIGAGALLSGPHEHEVSPAPIVAEVRADHLVVVVDGDHDGPHASVQQPHGQVLEVGSAGHLDHGLGHPRPEFAEAGAWAGRGDHCPLPRSSSSRLATKRSWLSSLAVSQWTRR